MNLYRHYKNLSYKVLGLARHSETLEELVLYETLYDNPKGRLWVRPKAMFYETIEHNGQTRPRFAKVNCEVVTHDSFTSETKRWIADIARQSYEGWDEKTFEDRAKNFHVFHISFAMIEGQPVGFKLGYANRPDEFYSWLGAVRPDYRRTGVASLLMAAQHEWCMGHDFRRITTKCLNFNHAMLTLNLKHGFLVVETELTEQGLKLILEKRLVETHY